MYFISGQRKIPVHSLNYPFVVLFNQIKTMKSKNKMYLCTLNG